MSSKIRVLPDHLINKIAAGEVIENPSSVVKELVENSLDAGATEVIIEIASGGRQMVRISDNGSGMGPDDALLCLERHGTSKIRNAEDLFQLSTMGFRGEAIPSIAAISKFTLVTRAKEDAEGTMVIVEGGNLLKKAPAIRDPGTTIEVKALFFNVPVRKKFQRSPAYDTAEILKMVSALSLAHPLVKFQLVSEGKTLLSAPYPEKKSFSEAFAERVAAVLGHDFLEESLPLCFEQGEYRLEGLIGNPANTRPNRMGQHLFLNQRAVWSPMVSHAVREGFGTMLPAQRYPVFALHLTMPGGLVDVNVHPQKREVRLRHEHELRQMITQAVFQSLKPAKVESFSPAPAVEPQFSFRPSFVLPKEPSAWLTPADYSPQPTTVRPLAVQELSLAAAKPSMRVAMTVAGYLILDKKELCLVDQTRAHQRVLFERFLNPSTKQPKDSQALLIPYSLELTPQDAAVLENCLEMLTRLGFGIQAFGRQTFLIDAVPYRVDNQDIRASLLQMIEEFREETAFQAGEKQALKLSSRFAVPSTACLSIAEGQHLVEQLLRCQVAHYCPQGRPIIKTYTAEDKLF